ncbi:hypothetical protein MKEN_00897600 [Mycena kentingensis (nom. inval.)]|nr:hypothetical protein MKEN_00897600 [Mycena kentingensis (nom. inval.)]
MKRVTRGLIPTCTMNQPRGVKRKRPEVDRGTKFGTKLFHTIREVQQAAKKARTFETQRLVKKIKGFKTSDADASKKLSHELEELKAVDTLAFAISTLRARLLKDSHISSHQGAHAAIDSQLPPQATGSGDKIRAKLSSNRTFAKAMADAVSGLRTIVLPPVDEKQTVEEDEDEGEEKDEEESEDDEDEALVAEVDEALVAEEEEPDAAGWESGSVEDAASDGWESGSVHSDESDDDAPPTKKLKPVTAPKPAPKPAASQSQFLPSLSVGYIRGSSSEPEDDIEDVDPKRKNRRGQRARQAIWEKKYGRGANHKKKEAAEAQAKLQARANRRDAASNSRGRPATRGNGRPWQQQQQQQRGPNPNMDPLGSKAPPPAKSSGGASTSAPALHPSWAAKRAQKEKAAAGIVPSQGKKIVFD